MKAVFLLFLSTAALFTVHCKYLENGVEDRDVFEWSVNAFEPKEDGGSVDNSFNADDDFEKDEDGVQGSLPYANSFEDNDSDEFEIDGVGVDESLPFSDSLDTDDFESESDVDSFHGDLPVADEISEDSFDEVADEVYGLVDRADNMQYEEYSLMGCRHGRCSLCFKVWKIRGCFHVSLTSRGIKIQFSIAGITLYSHTIKVSRSFTLRIKKRKLPKWLRRFLKSDVEIKFSSVDLRRRRLCVQVQVKVKFFGRVRWPRRSPHCFYL